MYASPPTETISWSAEGLGEVWQNLQEDERKRRRRFTKTDLFNGILNNRRLAMQRQESHQRMMELIKDEIEDIQRRTGVTEIHWSINWELAFMRHCLMNVQSMINHADARSDSREIIIHALNGRKLNFGRGSYVCCDGSLQFGADDTTGAWQKICLESTVRRFDVRNLELLVERVTELLGGVQLIVRPFGNLLHTIQFMQIFIGRICSQPKNERVLLKALIQGDRSVEIVNNYCELMSLDGCIQIPCNVDFQSLKQFLSANNSVKTEQTRQKHYEQQCLLESAKRKSQNHLRLTELSWDANLPFPVIFNSLQKLNEIDQNRAGDFHNLAIHLSSSPKILVLSNGKISLPVEWIDEL